MLPEYLFDNVAEYFDFLARYVHDGLVTGAELGQLRTGCTG